MTAASLDVSRHADLGLHAVVVADLLREAAPLGVDPIIVGAFARDLHLKFGHRIDTERATQDIDLAFAIPDWTVFDALNERLVRSTQYTPSPPARHRLRHRNGIPVDLVPFGPVETPERTIAWPPHGDVVMDVFGFREAEASAWVAVLPGGVNCRVVSLAALGLLKVVCWNERQYDSPGKDARDLFLITRSYVDAGNQARLYGEFADWTREDGFDYAASSARMLGHDIGRLLDDTGVEKVAAVLADQTDKHSPGRLPNQMLPDDPDRARSLLEAILGGLLEA